MPFNRPYPPEFREQAVRLYEESGLDVSVVAEQIGVSHQTLRNWLKQARVESGKAPGLTLAERAELRELRARAKRLEQENAFLKKAAAWFAAETDRSPSRKRSD
jgi:transposase